MKVLVSDDVHIYVLPDGSCWSDAINGYDFYKRYLDVFDSVRLVGRLKNVDQLPCKCLRLDGPGIEIYGIPFFQGPRQLIPKVFSIIKRLKDVSKNCDVAVLRMPSVTSFFTAYRIDKTLPLGIEIVYDPYNDINDSYFSITNKLMWRVMAGLMKRNCMKANGVAYVTQEAIQKHIPSYARIHGEDKNHFETNYSSIMLSNSAFASEPRHYKKTKKCTIALSDVAMNNDRKGESIFLNVVHNARKRGYEVSAILIGDGSMRKQYEQMCKEMEIDSYVTFTGLFPSSDLVREELKKADLFLFPTKAEGLPRGVLEAMALGLPVLSTPVGGIPEILPQSCMFDPMDVDGFTMRLCQLIDNPEEMTKLSEDNLAVAQQYRNDALQSRRNDFYSRLIQIIDDK